MGWFKCLFAIAIAVQWGILSAFIAAYETAGYLDPFSVTILKGSFNNIAAIAFPSVLFLIEGKREKRTISLSLDAITHYHRESSNHILANMSFRDSILQVGDQKGFARRIMEAYAEKNNELLAQDIIYDPRQSVTLIQAIATIFVLSAIFLMGLFFIHARAFGWLPELLSDEKLFSALSNALIGVIVALKLLNSRLFGIKESDW
jgi:hypothetical protein